MPNNNNATRFVTDGSQGPVLDYNVPEPTTYFGSMYFQINVKDMVASNQVLKTKFAGKWREVFRDFVALPFTGKQNLLSMLEPVSQRVAAALTRVLEYGPATAPPAAFSTSAARTVTTKTAATAALQHPLTDEELYYVISKLVFLPVGFEGFASIRRKMYGLGSANSATHEVTTAYTLPGNIAIKDELLQFTYGQVLNGLDYNHLAARILEGNFLALMMRLGRYYHFTAIPIPSEITPKIAIVEKYKLSNFLGNYGAGRTVSTFSLLPGEKTKLSIKTFKKTTLDSKQSSSILDSYCKESADDFEDTVNKERGDKHSHQDKLDWHVSVSEDLDFGFSDTKIDAGVAGSNANQREDMSKTITNSITKHAQKASSKRDVNINSTYENKEESGTETSTEREIENINVSRTLNFIFRQINQEYLSLLHLIDARIVYTNGLPGSYVECSVQDLGTPERIGDFLKNIFVTETASIAVMKSICNHLCFIKDYTGEFQSFLERQDEDVANPVIPAEPLHMSYIRQRRDLFLPPADSTKHFPNTFISSDGQLVRTVTGIIVSATTTVLRTDGLIVEALLGRGDALDTYSHGLQDESVRQKALANDKVALANQIISSGEADKGALYAELFPNCPMSVCCCCGLKDKPSDPKTEGAHG
ncbi:MAG: hypothetical protein JSS72_08930 [Armatimonadetes bacterium]|nr:hypothetical protein [Armatimonadota bacterium]